MLAARLNHKILIQVKAESKNQYGDMLESWSDLKHVWADKKYVGFRESVKYGVQNTNEVEYYIRWTDISYSCRIVDGLDTYNITAIEPIGRRESIRLRCSKV